MRSFTISHLKIEVIIILLTIIDLNPIWKNLDKISSILQLFSSIIRTPSFKYSDHAIRIWIILTQLLHDNICLNVKVLIQIEFSSKIWLMLAIYHNVVYQEPGLTRSLILINIHIINSLLNRCKKLIQVILRLNTTSLFAN